MRTDSVPMTTEELLRVSGVGEMCREDLIANVTALRSKLESARKVIEHYANIYVSDWEDAPDVAQKWLEENTEGE
jgi:hypothetical protein